MNVHLTFAGQCREALEFYRQLLGGDLTLLTYGESPAADQVGPDWKDKIVHATLSLGDRTLAGADLPPERFTTPGGFFLILEPADPAEAQRLFSALAEGGAVHMPLQPTFWSPAFGVVVDRFGTPWEVSSQHGPSGG